MAATGRVASFSRARFDSVTDDTRSEGSGADIGEDGAPGPETTPIMDLESGVRGQSSFHTATTHGTVGAHASARGAEHKAGTGVGGSAGAGAGVPEATAGAHVCAHKAQDSNHPRGARQPREGRFATSGVLSHSASGIVVSKAGGQSFRTSCSGCSASDANPQQARARTRAHTHTPPVLRSSAVLMAKAEQSVHDRYQETWRGTFVEPRHERLFQEHQWAESPTPRRAAIIGLTLGVLRHVWVMLGMFVGNDGPHAAAHNRDMAISLTFSLTGVLMLVLSWCPTVWMRRNWDAYICTAMLLLGLPFVLSYPWRICNNAVEAGIEVTVSQCTALLDGHVPWQPSIVLFMVNVLTHSAMHANWFATMVVSLILLFASIAGALNMLKVGPIVQAYFFVFVSVAVINLTARTHQMAERRFWASLRTTARAHRMQEFAEIKGVEATTRKEAAEAQALAFQNVMRYVCHELRNPLHGIMGLLEGVRGELDDAEDWVKDDVSTVWNAATSMAVILNDVLDLGQLQRGQMSLDAAPTDCYSLVERCVLTLQGIATVPIVSHVASTLPKFIMVDALRVSQIMTNAVSNAAKLTKKGQVDVVLQARGDQLWFEVFDTGCGLSSDATSLFQPYQQDTHGTARTTRNRFERGTGLGLAISAQLVRLMKGNIGLENRTDGPKGARFFFHIPLSVASAEQVRAAESQGSRFSTGSSTHTVHNSGPHVDTAHTDADQGTPANAAAPPNRIMTFASGTTGSGGSAPAAPGRAIPVQLHQERRQSALRSGHEPAPGALQRVSKNFVPDQRSSALRTTILPTGELQDQDPTFEVKVLPPGKHKPHTNAVGFGSSSRSMVSPTGASVASLASSARSHDMEPASGDDSATSPSNGQRHRVHAAPSAEDLAALLGVSVDTAVGAGAPPRRQDTLQRNGSVTHEDVGHVFGEGATRPDWLTPVAGSVGLKSMSFAESPRGAGGDAGPRLAIVRELTPTSVDGGVHASTLSTAASAPIPSRSGDVGAGAGADTAHASANASADSVAMPGADPSTVTTAIVSPTSATCVAGGAGGGTHQPRAGAGAAATGEGGGSAGAAARESEEGAKEARRQERRARAAARRAGRGVRGEGKSKSSKRKAKPTPFAGVRVLVVDDERVNRTVLTRHCTKTGCEVRSMEDGDQLLAAMNAGEVGHTPSGAVILDVTSPGRPAFDIIFLDIMMQRSNGEDVCQRLRAAGIVTPIVAATGNGMKEDIARYQADGFTTVMLKPFSSTTVAGVLRELVAPARGRPASASSRRRDSGGRGTPVPSAAAVAKAE